MSYFRYLNYVIRHRWFVMLECFKYGLYWQGLTHDLSKLLPSEFFPYANFFYGDRGGSIKNAFDFAWLLHQKRNKHHWQWWCLPEDEGGLKVLEMPLKYRLEMLCDWRGAGRAQGHPDVLPWYEKNRNRMVLGMATQIWIEQQLYTVEELKAKVGTE